MYSRKIGDRKRGKAPLVAVSHIVKALRYETITVMAGELDAKPVIEPTFIGGLLVDVICPEVERVTISWEVDKVVWFRQWKHPRGYKLSAGFGRTEHHTWHGGTVTEWQRCQKRGCSTCRDYSKPQREARRKADAEFDLQAGLDAMAELEPTQLFSESAFKTRDALSDETLAAHRAFAVECPALTR